MNLLVNAYISDLGFLPHLFVVILLVYIQELKTAF